MNPPERPVDKPFRLCVGDVFKGMGSGISVTGTIHAGTLQVGERVIVMPQGEPGAVKSKAYYQIFFVIKKKSLVSCDWAHLHIKLLFVAIQIDEVSSQFGFAGDNVTITLTGIDPTNIGVGKKFLKKHS